MVSIMGSVCSNMVNFEPCCPPHVHSGCMLLYTSEFIGSGGSRIAIRSVRNRHIQLKTQLDMKYWICGYALKTLLDMKTGYAGYALKTLLDMKYWICGYALKTLLDMKYWICGYALKTSSNRICGYGLDMRICSLHRPDTSAQQIYISSESVTRNSKHSQQLKICDR